MSPLFLIKLMELERRTGTKRPNRTHLKAARLVSVLRNLFAVRRPTCDCR
jgi:hypothetical protein